MTTKQTPSIPEIKDAVAAHFNIQAEDLTPKAGSHKNFKAKRMAVFLCAKADYSDADIADAFDYKTKNHVSGIFNKAQLSYSEGRDNFYFDANAIAKSLKLSLR